jgi:S1-C subfamily serine protease
VIRTSDVIQSIDENQVTSASAFQQLARARVPGTPVAIGLVRVGKPEMVTITARDLAPAPPAGEDYGAVLRNAEGAGVEAVTTVPGGPAAAAGLQRGDLIVAVNGNPAPTVAAFERAYRAAAPDQALLLTVQRGSQHVVLALEKP